MSDSNNFRLIAQDGKEKVEKQIFKIIRLGNKEDYEEPNLIVKKNYLEKSSPGSSILCKCDSVCGCNIVSNNSCSCNKVCACDWVSTCACNTDCSCNSNTNICTCDTVCTCNKVCICNLI